MAYRTFAVILVQSLCMPRSIYPITSSGLQELLKIKLYFPVDERHSIRECTSTCKCSLDLTIMKSAHN